MSKGLKSKCFLTLSFLAVFLALIFEVQIVNASEIKCGTTGDIVIPRILGGQKIERGEWPFLAALILLKDSRFFCGGTIISTKHILTAAHCVKHKNSKVSILPSDIAVLLGAYDLTARFERHKIQGDISEILVHPDWKVFSDKYDADICILVLSEAVSFTNYIRPVCMPADDTVINGAMGYIVGWGLDENHLRPHIEFPKRAAIMSLNSSYCYTTDYVAAFLSSQRSFCGMGEEQSPNKGDSGGGFFVLSSSAWVQYGIISAIRTNETGHVDANSIAVYTNIKWFKSWIVETVRKTIGAANEKDKLKISLDCDYGFGDVDKKTYGCWLDDLEIQSENVEVTSFSGTHAYNKTDEDVKLIQFRNGTIFSLPNEVGTFFKNLRKFDVGTGSSSLKTKLIRRSNWKKLQNLIDLAIYKNDIETLDEDTLWDLPNLELFVLSRNRLKLIEEKTFQKNTKLRKVYITSNQLEFLPRNLLQNNLLLEEVGFDNNKLQEIHENIFEKNTKLRKVYLHSNELEFLPWNLFQNNALLEIVSFFENHLKEIHENTFEKNKQLKHVYLKSNQLEFLPRNLFENNLLLEVVGFDENNLKEIHENTFEKNMKLREVYLHSNELEVLPSNLFENNLLLEIVNFRGNLLREIHENTFRKNTKLKKVDLNSNQLEFLPRNLFEHNVLLESVSFYDNTLKVIDENIFRKNTKLREVYLNFNLLEFLPRNLLQNNLLLEEVRFDNIKLKVIHENIFRKNTKLKKVYLYSNQVEFFPKNLLQNNLLLEEVRFDNNKLKAIHENTFQKNTKLRKLYLYSNQLEFLPRNLLQNNLLLEEVRFNNNKLKVIDETTFRNNTKLKKVYLYSNKLEFLPRNLFENNLLLELVDFSENSLKIIEIKFAEFKNIRQIFLHNNVCTQAYYDDANDPTEYSNMSRNLTEFQSLINKNCSSANP